MTRHGRGAARRRAQSRYLARLAEKNPSALAVSAALAAELSKQEETDMNENRIATLTESITTNAHELLAIVRGVTVEPPPREIAPLIVQLGDVEREIDDHNARFPYNQAKPIDGAYSCEEEKAEWKILHSRRLAIQDALSRYAKAATQPRMHVPANETQSGWHMGTSAGPR